MSGISISNEPALPWVFRETKSHLESGEVVDPPTLEERWKLILRHCELHVREWGIEEPAIRSLRSRLMAYSKSMPEAKRLRERFSQVSTLAEVGAIAEENILNQATVEEAASFRAGREANSFAYKQ